MREKPGEARFFTILGQVHHHTLFKNIYVGHLHFISSKCHILTSNTLIHVFTVRHLSYIISYYMSRLVHALIGQLSGPYFTEKSRFPVASYLDVRLARLLLLILFLGQEHVTNPQERLRGRLDSQSLFGKNEPALQLRSQGSLLPVPTERHG